MTGGAGAGVVTEWENGSRLRFRTPGVEGTFLADGQRHGVSRLVHRPSGTEITAGPLLAVYRLLCRGGWMGEAREMPHAVRVHADGVELRWRPCSLHHAALRVRLHVREADALDLALDVVGHAAYPGYEVFVSNYLHPAFRLVCYAAPRGGEALDGPLRVEPTVQPLYRGMYVAFPRDEAAAHLFTDGRWQRGRHWTRFLPARYYGHPLACARHLDSGVDVLFMGLRRDVAAMSMAYNADSGEEDDVASRHSLYASLWGRDLHPGEAWRAVLRLQVGNWRGDAAAHVRAWEAFAAQYADRASLPEVPEVDSRLVDTW